jgi:TonB family protein
VFDTTQVSEKPHAIRGPPVSYPVDLRVRRVEGTVVIGTVINADGSVDRDSITILRGDLVAFEREALRWLAGARFWPGCREGRAVRVRIALPFTWRIRG